MSNPNLNELLKWGITNSAGSSDQIGRATSPQTSNDRNRTLNREALAQLLGGPSDADRMREAMAAIQCADMDLENKMIAFDNLEQLIENIDNANNMESLGLWMPLVAELENSEPALRLMAAWCIGTAVQNNPRAQERCLVIGAIPKLVKMSLEDEDAPTRRKAVFALSSEVRNYQPAMDELVKLVPREFRSQPNYDAGDMNTVDSIMNKLKGASKEFV